MTLLDAGACEPLKRTVHLGLLALAAACVAYNVAAYIVRRERHLAVNVGFYTLVVIVECAQVQRHGGP